jgi:putative hydrolase of the HAD superfamily
MVLIFDLDDTLYEERTYVSSGFRAVARWLERQFHWDPEVSYRCMSETLECQGRGKIFDRVLQRNGKLTAALVRACVSVYRHHEPDIQLLPAARDLIPKLSGNPLYLVTDGHKISQAGKIKALGIDRWFEKAYLTRRYGIRYAKPSIFCFERIRRREGCRWNEMIHIGDNPEKDFVNLNPKGVHTVRVLTGMRRRVVARHGYEARYRISDLTYFPRLLQEIRL